MFLLFFLMQSDILQQSAYCVCASFLCVLLFFAYYIYTSIKSLPIVSSLFLHLIVSLSSIVMSVLYLLLLYLHCDGWVCLCCRCGPPSLVLAAGQRVARLPPQLECATHALLWPWDEGPGIARYVVCHTRPLWPWDKGPGFARYVVCHTRPALAMGPGPWVRQV